MGVKPFHGDGVGLGVGVGCGFGVGWGFGGVPVGWGGLGVGAGCGVGAGLGWGRGVAIGSHYISSTPEFTESKEHKPSWTQQVMYVITRVKTLHKSLPEAEGR